MNQSKVIYKYLLNPHNRWILMPPGAIVRHVDSQGDLLALWAEVDSMAACTEHRQFRIYRTGHPIPLHDNLEFIGTIKQYDGGLMFHVFEKLSFMII